MALPRWYTQWHQNPHHHLWHWAFFLSSAGLATVLILSTVNLQRAATLLSSTGTVDILSMKRRTIAPDQVLLKLKPGMSIDAQFLRDNNLRTAGRLIGEFHAEGKAKQANEDTGMDRIYLAKINGTADPRMVAQALAADDRVEYAEPDYVVQADVQPNDPFFGNLWGMHQSNDVDIDAPEAWDQLTGSANGIVVGIVDSGIDYTHPDLAANVWTNPGEIPDNKVDDDHNGFVDDIHGYDFVNGDGDPMDDNSHGTHVAGTIGAVGNNADGVAGVNWSTRMAALKFLNNLNQGTISNAVRAISYANMMGFKVTNNSWSGSASKSLSDAISAAKQAGNLFVASAGNSASNNDAVPVYPASYPQDNIISVAGVANWGALVASSNYGATSVDIAAPGQAIYSTLPVTLGLYGNKTGTSMAAPHVTGAAALLWAHDPTLSYTAVRQRILDRANPQAYLLGKVASNGLLNLANIVNDAYVPSSSAASSVAVSSSSVSSATSSTVSSASTALPTVAIISPAPGPLPQKGNITIVASATPASTIAITLNGSTQKTCAMASTCSFSWGTAQKIAAGTYIIGASATTAAGTAQTSITVTK